MKIPVEIRKYAQIKASILGIFSVGSMILMVWWAMNSIKRQEEFNYWLWVAVFVPPYIMLGLMPMEKAYALSGNDEIESYVRIGWKKFNRRVFPRPTKDQIQIRQDAERYYCVILTLGNKNEILIVRFPVLREADEWMTRLREALCYA